MDIKRYYIELAYKGTNFHGWQIQLNAVTVQETLEKALSLKLQQEIRVVGAGRTDTGVHAKFFVAHFDSSKNIDEKTVFGLNNLLPNDIVIFKIEKVKSDFNARFDAMSRTYKYYITNAKSPFLIETTTFIKDEINMELLNKAGEILFNYTDFTSFSKLHTDTKTNNCKITNAKWYLENNIIVFEITADRFLRNMVRSIVGTLLDVNSGKTSLSDFSKIIESQNRSKAGKSAPAQGLFLTKIEYDNNIFII